MRSRSGFVTFLLLLGFLFFCVSGVSYGEGSLQSMSTDELLNLGIATLINSKNSMKLTDDQLRLLLENLGKSENLTDKEIVLLEKSLQLSETNNASIVIIESESKNLSDSSEKKEQLIQYSLEFLENSKKEERKRVIKLSFIWGGITLSVVAVIGGVFGWWLHSTISK